MQYIYMVLISIYSMFFVLCEVLCDECVSQQFMNILDVT